MLEWREGTLEPKEGGSVRVEEGGREGALEFAQIAWASVSRIGPKMISIDSSQLRKASPSVVFTKNPRAGKPRRKFLPPPRLFYLTSHAQ